MSSTKQNKKTTGDEKKTTDQVDDDLKLMDVSSVRMGTEGEILFRIFLLEIIMTHETEKFTEKGGVPMF